MNPELGIKKLSLFHNPLVVILFLFLVQSATAYNIWHNATIASRHNRNLEVQLHGSSTPPSQPIHQNQSFLHDIIQMVKNTTNDFVEELPTNFNVHHRPKRSDEEGPNLRDYRDYIENKIGNLSKKISSLQNSDTSNREFKTRISDLETRFKNLQTTVDTIIKNETGEIDTNDEEKMDNFTQSANNLNLRIDNLAEEIREEAARRLPAEIVNDVKSHHFFNAMKKLHEKDGDLYYYVVHEIYNKRASNFDLLLNFGDYITNVENKFKIYDFLFKEAVVSGLNDPRKILRLRQSIKSKVIDETIGALAAINLHNLLRSLMEEAAVEPIYSAFLYNNSWTTVKQLSTEISEDCPECTNRIFNLVIKTIWNKITIEDILCRSHKNLNIRENMAVHLAVMNTLKRTGGLHNTSVITIARFMKLTMEDSNYKSEFLHIKSQYEQAKNEIPEPVKNLVFSSAICIKDQAHNEYLYAGAAPDYVYDDNRRHVFTWIPGDRDEPPKFKWYVKFYNSQEIMLRNDKYSEYLYADGISYDDTRRYVFTWRPNNTVTNGIWRVEIDGNYIHMFNTEHGGYIFADHNEIKDKSRRYVFTNREGGKTPDSKWEIVDCSHFQPK